jgi:hypothetical protein
MLATAELAVLAVEIYFGVGILFAVVFVWRGVGSIDQAAQSGTLGFRLLILPASALLWPLMARRWWRGAQPPVERNAHRDAASAAAASRRAPGPGGGS